MNKTFNFAAILFTAHLALFADEPPSAAPSSSTLPPFDELYGLIKSHVKSLKPEQLNAAAVRGLLDQLSSDVVLVTDQQSQAGNSLLIATNTIIEGATGYMRIARIEAGLATQVREAHQRLVSSNKLNGLVLDLRFANGQQYPEAGRVVDLFLSEEQPLIEMAETTIKSNAKTDPIATPVVVLVNDQTAGAAEALGGALRASAGALVIGKPTAGRARVFQEFTLTGGQKIKLATGTIRLGDSTEIAANGLTPDVPVPVSVEEEKLYLADPYRIIPRAALVASAEAGNGRTNGAARPRRPRNEAELIRLRREGLPLDEISIEPPAEEATRPVLQDPALARAVDFLKGLTLIQKRR